MCCTLALKDWVIKYSWKPVHTGVLLNTFLKQMLSPPCWFIIQVEFGWRSSSRPPWTLLTLKTKKLTLGLIGDSFCLLAVGNVKKTKTTGWLPQQPLRRASTRQSYQYLRFLSPSDMLFIVKSGTSLGLSLVCLRLKIHLTLRDSVKCIVSSQESKRLWRWPWEDTGSYFLLCVKGGWCDGSSDCSSACLRVYVRVQVVTLRWGVGVGFRITGDEEGVSAPIEYCCSILQTS